MWVQCLLWILCSLASTAILSSRTGCKTRVIPAEPTGWALLVMGPSSPQCEFSDSDFSTWRNLHIVIVYNRFGKNPFFDSHPTVVFHWVAASYPTWDWMGRWRDGCCRSFNTSLCCKNNSAFHVRSPISVLNITRLYCNTSEKTFHCFRLKWVLCPFIDSGFVSSQWP